MNKPQRKELERASALLAEAKEIIEFIAGEERDKYDNLPEGFQMGDSGQKLEQAADDLDSLEDDIDTAINTLDEIINA